MNVIAFKPLRSQPADVQRRVRELIDKHPRPAKDVDPYTALLRAIDDWFGMWGLR